MKMNVNKMFLFLVLVGVISCNINSNFENGIYYNQETQSLVALRNDTLIFIKDTLSGVCDKYILHEDIFVSRIYGDNLKISNNNGNIQLKQKGYDYLDYQAYPKPQWDSLQGINERRKIYWRAYNNKANDNIISDADIGAFLLIHGIRMTPLQTTDQDPMTMKVYINDEAYSSTGAINWMCLDIFN